MQTLPHIVPLLKATDDVLEHIIQIATQDITGRCGHRKIVTLSHVCSRLRRIILFRAAFWSELRIGGNTSPDSVEAVLHRSQSVPLCINVVGIGGFKRIRDSGVTLEALFEIVAKSITKAEALRISGLQPAESVLLSQACGVVKLAHQDFGIRVLAVWYSSFDNVMLNLAVGTYLATLDLVNLKEPTLPALSKILHLAPNLEVLCVFGLVNSIDLPETLISRIPATGSRLQIIQLDSAGRSGTEFAHIVEMIQRYSPQAILDGRIVELRDTNDASCIAEMSLERFGDVESIACNRGSEFTIQYPVQALPTRRPVGAHALANQMHLGRLDWVTRGFDADLNDLFEPLSLAREVLRRLITMARSLSLCDISPLVALQLFIILAHDSWPKLEHISLELHISLSYTEYPLEWDRGLIDVPHLRDVDIALRSPKSGMPKSPSVEVIQSWAQPCVTIMNALSAPNTTNFVVRLISTGHNDDPGVVSVLAAVRQAFGSDRLAESLADATG